MALKSVQDRKRRETEREETRKAEETAAKPAEQKSDGNKEPKPNSDQGGGAPKVERKVNPAPARKADVVAPDPGDVELERVLRLEEHKRRLDNAEWDRRKRIEVLQGRVAQERKDARRGNGFTRFTTTFNGRRARTVGSWRQTGGRSSSRSASALTPTERELDRLLAGEGDGLGGLGVTGRKSATLDWMPKDTSKDAKQRFGASDFFGRDNRGRSSRYAGGYLSAEFRENFINSRMEGLNPGDAGYDAVRRRAEGAWGQAVKQYDRQFMQFGQEKLKEQSRLDFQQRRDALMKQQDEARQSQKKAEAAQMEKAGIKGYDRDAKMEGLDLTNRELERIATDAVRNSYRNTGVAGQVTIGSPVNSNVQIGAAAARRPAAGGAMTETWASDPSNPLKDAVVSRGTVLRVGDRVGGVEMNTARREQDATIAQMTRTDAAMKGVEKQNAGTFELMTGMKREESRKSAGGRYAGNGTIVFGDQKTFDAVVARNQQKRRMLT